MMRTLYYVLSCLVPLALAQSLTFVRPDFSSLDTNDNGIPQFTAGDNVTVRRESGFQYTTVSVYQEIEQSVYRVDVLARAYFCLRALSDLWLTIMGAEDARPDRTEAEWQVGALAEGDDLSGPFHFELKNARDSECEGCSLNSENFVVSQRRQTSSVGASSTASPSPMSTGSETTSASSTATLDGAQSSPTSSSAAQRGSNDSLRLGLGVGLGVGIPLLLVAFGLLFCFRRRKQRRNSLPRGRQPSPAHSSDRASGAWLHQDARQSQQSMLFRPSTAARSEMSSWSHRSWIEPFDFEETEMRDRDAMSQLRQSIYSSSRGRRSQVSLSNAGSEWGGALEGIPEQPQIVHDSSWSSPRQ